MTTAKASGELTTGDTPIEPDGENNVESFTNANHSTTELRHDVHGTNRNDASQLLVILLPLLPSSLPR